MTQPAQDLGSDGAHMRRQQKRSELRDRLAGTPKQAEGTPVQRRFSLGLRTVGVLAGSACVAVAIAAPTIAAMTSGSYQAPSIVRGTPRLLIADGEEPVAARTTKAESIEVPTEPSRVRLSPKILVAEPVETLASPDKVAALESKVAKSPARQQGDPSPEAAAIDVTPVVITPLKPSRSASVAAVSPPSTESPLEDSFIEDVTKVDTVRAQPVLEKRQVASPEAVATDEIPVGGSEDVFIRGWFINGLSADSDKATPKRIKGFVMPAVSDPESQTGTPDGFQLPPEVLIDVREPIVAIGNTGIVELAEPVSVDEPVTVETEVAVDPESVRGDSRDVHPGGVQSDASETRVESIPHTGVSDDSDRADDGFGGSLFRMVALQQELPALAEPETIAEPMTIVKPEQTMESQAVVESDLMLAEPQPIDEPQSIDEPEPIVAQPFLQLEDAAVVVPDRNDVTTQPQGSTYVMPVTPTVSQDSHWLDIRPRAIDGGSDALVNAGELPPDTSGLGQPQPVPQLFESYQTDLSMRQFWAGASFCHRPLRFEDPMLERYGQSGCVGEYCPTIRSGMHFTWRTAVLPLSLALDPPWDLQRSGYKEPRVGRRFR